MLEGGRNSRPNFIKHGQLGTVHHTMIDLSTNPRPPSTERVFFTHLHSFYHLLPIYNIIDSLFH
jgi:hypothetical protein